MHKEILSKSQTELLPFISKFKTNFYLVGGTAIALHIAHRRSIDFDLFLSAESLNHGRIKKLYKDSGYSEKRILYEAPDQLDILIHKVKITFFCYPYKIAAGVEFDSFARIPDLLDLSAMKALALGGRAKWKDYVDMYFILKHYFPLEQVMLRANELFGDMFSPKLLQQQLTYFEDIDYTEEIEFIHAPVSENEIKDFLIQAATEKF